VNYTKDTNDFIYPLVVFTSQGMLYLMSTFFLSLNILNKPPVPLLLMPFALFIPSPTFLTGHYDNVIVPISVSTNMPVDISDGSMLVANGGQQID
jgi:hypothetical protein